MVVVIVMLVVVVVVVVAGFHKGLCQLLETFNCHLIYGKSVDIYIVVFTSERVHVKANITYRPIEAKNRLIFVVNRVIVLLQLKTGIARQLFWNSIVYHVHNATNRAATIKQRRRASNNFETVSQKRLYAISMVRTDV